MGTTGKGCWPGVCGTQNFHVHFPRTFAKKPSVSVSFSGLDVGSDNNLRAYSSPVSVTTSSFDIRFSTWSDTKIYSMRFSWIACA